MVSYFLLIILYKCKQGIYVSMQAVHLSKTMILNCCYFIQRLHVFTSFSYATLSLSQFFVLISFSLCIALTSLVPIAFIAMATICNRVYFYYTYSFCCSFYNVFSCQAVLSNTMTTSMMTSIVRMMMTNKTKIKQKWLKKKRRKIKKNTFTYINLQIQYLKGCGISLPLTQSSSSNLALLTTHLVVCNCNNILISGKYSVRESKKKSLSNKSNKKSSLKSLY